MLKFYQEIKLFPEEEIPIHFLWSKVYQQIHLGLVEIQDDQKRVPIGVSFPEYVQGDKYSILGSKCRLFAQDEATLIRFDAAKWLSRLSDYVHCTSIRPVPGSLKGYAIYQRQQPKTNKERLARRYAKRHNLDFLTALHAVVDLSARAESGTEYKTQFCYNDLPKQRITTPFIRLHSLTSQQTFCLWIKKSQVSEAVSGCFSTYGLSAQVTVPEF